MSTDIRPILLITLVGQAFRSKASPFPNPWSPTSAPILQVDSPFGIFIQQDEWRMIDGVSHQVYVQAPVVKQGKRWTS